MESRWPQIVAARRVLAWAALVFSFSGLLAAVISSQYPHAMHPPHPLDPNAPRYVTWLEQWVPLSALCTLVTAVLSFPRWQIFVAFIIMSVSLYLMIR